MPKILSEAQVDALLRAPTWNSLRDRAMLETYCTGLRVRAGRRARWM